MQIILNHLLRASIAVCILVPVLCLIRRVFRRRLDHRLLYAAWLIIALRLLMPLSIETILTTPVTWEGVHNYPAGVTEPSVPHGAIQVPDQAPQPAITAGQMVCIVWAAGAMAAGGLMHIRNVRFRKRLQLSPTCGEIQAMQDTVCAHVGLRTPLPVYHSAAVQSPCLIGAYRPMVVLTANASPTPQLRYALLHEACHARAFDTRWAALRNALCCLFWFHPLVWLAAHVSRADSELACDARVTAYLAPNDRFQYAKALVEVAMHQQSMRPLGSHGISFADARLRDRVNHIVEVQTLRKTSTLLISCLLALLLLASFVSAESAPNIGASAPNATIYVYGNGDDYEEKTLKDSQSVTIHAIRSHYAWVTAGDLEGYIYMANIQVPEDYYKDKTAWVNNPGDTDRLNLREQPSTSSIAKDAYFNGVEVKVLAFGNTWCHVEIDDETGYMMSPYLLFGDADVLERLPNPPTNGIRALL